MRITFAVLTAASCFALVVAVFSTPELKILKTTDKRIRDYGYPVEIHKVLTKDGYFLTMFRIPYSPKLLNVNGTKPAVFLQHGFTYSSDSWITNGPNDALAFLFVDAGYDVWLGNSRGNTYSKRHRHLSLNDKRFWDFSWHEIALFDLPACIDHILDITGQPALYYVGHSQGTTTFFILMSTDVSYNAKIKIGFMLAPVGYMNHMKSPIAKLLAPFLGPPSALSRLIGNKEFLPSLQIVELLGSKACSEQLPLQKLCLVTFFMLAGFDYKYFNYSMLSDVFETFPTGSSLKQGIHYLQEYKSGRFRQYDYGVFENLQRYKQISPPDYRVEKITAKVAFYYGANDWFASVVDVRRLAVRLQNLIEATLMPFPEWNHFDFLWSILVKKALNSKIINTVNANEVKLKQFYGKN